MTVGVWFARITGLFYVSGNIPARFYVELFTAESHYSRTPKRVVCADDDTER